MSELSSRYRLPFLVSGQGQKDVTHNEAILIIDALLHPLILSRTLTEPVADPSTGDCWLIPEGASGVWLGKAGQLAVWTVGGWRFLQPAEGYSAWVKSERRRIRRLEEGWRDEPAFEAAQVPILAPVGGPVVDSEARATLSEILVQLSDVGLLKSA